MDAQVKMTDIVRSELMDFVYSEESVEDAYHLQAIFKQLEAIDIRFSDIDEEMKELRRRNVTLSVENRQLKSKIESNLTDSFE